MRSTKHFKYDFTSHKDTLVTKNMKNEQSWGLIFTHACKAVIFSPSLNQSCVSSALTSTGGADSAVGRRRSRIPSLHRWGRGHRDPQGGEGYARRRHGRHGWHGRHGRNGRNGRRHGFLSRPPRVAARTQIGADCGCGIEASSCALQGRTPGAPNWPTGRENVGSASNSLLTPSTHTIHLHWENVQ